MSSRSKRRQSGEEDEDVKPPASVRRRSTQSQDVGDDDEEVEAVDEGTFGFSSQAPEASQSVQAEKVNERRNLDQMDPAARQKALTSLSRLILFRGLEREPLDRLKLVKDAGIDTSDRITTAAFQVAHTRLANVFGFQLNRLPKYAENIKQLNSDKFKNRFYLQNAVVEGQDGKHSKAIHMVHKDSAIENGLLMLILAFIYCKGDCRADGSRWILSRDLYRLLHSVDDAIPEEPPAQGTARAKAAHKGATSFLAHGNLTPNVDALLEKFITWDFLVKEKATDDNFHTQHTGLEEGDILYSMGPRSLIEVGKKQIIHFCSTILDEEPDPTMLKDLEEEIQEAEDDEVFMEA